MGMWIKGWSEEECLARFQHLARRVFEPRVEFYILRAMLWCLCGATLAGISPQPVGDLSLARLIMMVAFLPVVGRLQGGLDEAGARLLLWYLSGSIYGHRVMDRSLQEAFGADDTIDGDSWASRYGIHVAIPATEVPGNRCCLFNNYNGVTARAARGGRVPWERCMRKLDHRVADDYQGTNACPPQRPAREFGKCECICVTLYSLALLTVTI